MGVHWDMQFDPQQATPGEVYSTMIRAITPRPIAWVSTISARGIPNLAPFSYFNGVCSSPAALSISPVNKPDGTKKDTVVNIEATGQFVVNVVPHRLAAAMHQSSAEYPPQVSEFAELELTPMDSIQVRPPRLRESPVQFECEVLQIIPVGTGPLAANLIIGKIVLMHIDDEVLDERGKIDPERVDTIGRLGGLEYADTRSRFALPPARLASHDET